VSNFYHDNEDILFHMENMDWSRIIDLKEDGFAEYGTFPEAPKDAEDAIDNYKRVLEIVGDISGEFVAPRAPEADEEGAHYADGVVTYAKATAEAIDRFNKADLMGFTLPRKYDGLNMPKTVYAAAIEMVSRADGGFMNLFGLQDIADTILKFGSEDQKQRYLPRFSSGEVMGSMALTEPDAGSDLQAVMLRAILGEDGKWRLNGVKRFITNGCAQVSLVMARSEEGTQDGRGISLFIYERDENMRIRRIEHKLGIHTSPTCELQFNNAEAELLGKRKMGLIKYTMSLMNGARLAIAAQAVGIAEAAYREADKYVTERAQFKKAIRKFPAVYEMLTTMKVGVEAGRSLLFETARIVDIKEGIEEILEHHPERKKDLRGDLQHYTKLAALFTPLCKFYTTEMCNKVAYDGIQIHGGVGFTTEFNAERHYRDARITNIYEGTTQLQVVAAIGGVVTGVCSEWLSACEGATDFTPVADLFEKAKRFRTQLEAAVSFVKEKNDLSYQEYHAGRLVQMASDTVISYLLCADALKCERKVKVAEVFIKKAENRVTALLAEVRSDDTYLMESHETIIGGAKAVVADEE
jgi:alkylation response protein AidB-like acyl-CoA dehydrogenase